MNDKQPSSKECFTPTSKIEKPEFQCRVLPEKTLIRFTGGRNWSAWDMDVAEARELRDWLNKALPALEPQPASSNEQLQDGWTPGPCCCANKGINFMAHFFKTHIREGNWTPMFVAAADEIERLQRELGRATSALVRNGLGLDEDTAHEPLSMHTGTASVIGAAMEGQRQFDSDPACPTQPPSVGHWEPIDTAPKDGRTIWIGADCSIRIAYWRDDTWVDWIKNEARISNGSIGPRGVNFKPTHWMRLPDPPALASETGGSQS